MIRPASPSDTKAICEIYNHYILHSHATFETARIDEFEMNKRVQRVQKELNLPWNVLEVSGETVGYSYATQWKPRGAYSKTTETSVYLDKDQFGKGYGQQLYSHLLDQLKRGGYHAIIGGISLPNEGSIRLHEKLGFQKVGVLKEVGYKFDRWIDVGYWELTF